MSQIKWRKDRPPTKKTTDHASRTFDSMAGFAIPRHFATHASTPHCPSLHNQAPNYSVESSGNALDNEALAHTAPSRDGKPFSKPIPATLFGKPRIKAHQEKGRPEQAAKATPLSHRLKHAQNSYVNVLSKNHIDGYTPHSKRTPQRQKQEKEMLERELLDMRQHLRLSDEDEPWVITKRFVEINKKVDEISTMLRKTLIKLPETSNCPRLTSTDLVDSLSAYLNLPHTDQGNTPVATAYSIGVDEFIEFGCRSMLNGLLIDTVLNHTIFHLEWAPEINRHFHETYEQLQATDVQINTGRWRLLTFKTIPNDVHDLWERMANDFCESTLIPFCQTAYSPEACTNAKELIFPEIIAVLKQAHSWNYYTRSTVITLDFRAIHYWPGDSFNGDFARLENSKAKASSPEIILLTTQLGLCSYRSTGNGDRECVCQTEAVVLERDYFRE